jgi:hypothetical protein
MAANYREGLKQQPGHAADMMRDFAKPLVWTAAMAKGLPGGLLTARLSSRTDRAKSCPASVPM